MPGNHYDITTCFEPSEADEADHWIAAALAATSRVGRLSKDDEADCWFPAARVQALCRAATDAYSAGRLREATGLARRTVVVAHELCDRRARLVPEGRA